jgi:hypothetical protein
MTTTPRPISDLDVSALAVEAGAHLIDLQAHPVPPGATVKERHDWYAAAFRDLAACNPDACDHEADYAEWAAALAAQPTYFRPKETP